MNCNHSLKGTQQLAGKPAMRPGELPGGCQEAAVQTEFTKPSMVTPWPQDLVTLGLRGGFLQRGLHLARSWLSRRLSGLTALADTQEGKTAWPWQLPTRKEPTSAREKMFPWPDPLPAALVSLGALAPWTWAQQGVVGRWLSQGAKTLGDI